VRRKAREMVRIVRQSRCAPKGGGYLQGRRDCKDGGLSLPLFLQASNEGTGKKEAQPRPKAGKWWQAGTGRWQASAGSVQAGRNCRQVPCGGPGRQAVVGGAGRQPPAGTFVPNGPGAVSGEAGSASQVCPSVNQKREGAWGQKRCR